MRVVSSGIKVRETMFKKKFRIKNKIKKELKNFLVDEEGTMSKENILKIGIGSAAMVGFLGTADSAHAGSCSHSNSVGIGHSSLGGGCEKIYTTHSNHCSHSSY